MHGCAIYAFEKDGNALRDGVCWVVKWCWDVVVEQLGVLLSEFPHGHGGCLARDCVIQGKKATLAFLRDQLDGSLDLASPIISFAKLWAVRSPSWRRWLWLRS